MELPGTIQEIKELFGQTCYVFHGHTAGQIIRGKITGVRVGDLEPLFEITHEDTCSTLVVASRIFLTLGEAIDAHNRWLESKYIKPDMKGEG